MVPRHHCAGARKHCRQRAPAGAAQPARPVGERAVKILAVKPHVKLLIIQNLVAHLLNHAVFRPASHHAVILQCHNLRHQQHRDFLIKPQPMPAPPKQPVRPMPPQHRRPHPTQDFAQQARVFLLLTNEQLDRLLVVAIARPVGQPAGRRAQPAPIRAFSQLKSRQRPRQRAA